MADFSATKARRVLAALLRIGWKVKREVGGSHKTLSRDGWPGYTWAFHEGDEIGPVMLRKIARRTGLEAEDL